MNHMEQFKMDIFKKEIINKEFPWFRSLGQEECRDIRDSINKCILGEDVRSPLDLVHKVSELQLALTNYNAEQDNFSLSGLMDNINIVPNEYIYINWYRYDNIDTMKFKDFDSCFEHIWYPGPDDIDIFDKSFKWILSINHEGDVSIYVQ